MTHEVIKVIDSHTGGEPTRIVVDGFPLLQGETVALKCKDFENRLDHLRRAIIQEPRCADHWVGGILCESAQADAGVIFFNNEGSLGMCGHGLIGLVATMRWLKMRCDGTIRIETPVGIVSARSIDGQRVEIENVVSYRRVKALEIPVDFQGRQEVFLADIAWGGNWFLIVQSPQFHIALCERESLESLAKYLLRRVREMGYQEVDHVELFGEPDRSLPGAESANSRSFVLCPGGQYDRSPCGTGTSAKIACLAEDGKLAPDQRWVQQSITGSVFEATYQVAAPLAKPSKDSTDVDALDEQDQRVPVSSDIFPKMRILPKITGAAYITSESNLILSEDDPACFGMVP